MAKGDHIKVRRLGYSHHGVDCGDGTVIHFAGEEREKERPRVRQTAWADFAKGARVHVAHRAVDPDASVARAERFLNASDYSLLFHNCEHFACWCATNRHASRQVKRVAAGIGLAVAALATALVLRRAPRG